MSHETIDDATGDEVPVSCETIERELAAARSRAEAAERELGEARALNAILANDRDSIADHLHLARQQLADLRDNAYTLEGRVGALKDELEEAESANAALREQLSRAEMRVSGLDADALDLVERNSQLQNQLTAMEGVAKFRAEELERIESARKAAVELADRLNGTIVWLQGRVTEYKEQRDAAERRAREHWTNLLTALDDRDKGWWLFFAESWVAIGLHLNVCDVVSGWRASESHARALGEENDRLRREMGLKADGHRENERDPLVVQVEINAELVERNRALSAQLEAARAKFAVLWDAAKAYVDARDAKEFGPEFRTREKIRAALASDAGQPLLAELRTLRAERERLRAVMTSWLLKHRCHGPSSKDSPDIHWPRLQEDFSHFCKVLGISESMILEEGLIALLTPPADAKGSKCDD